MTDAIDRAAGRTVTGFHQVLNSGITLFVPRAALVEYCQIGIRGQ